MRILLVWPLINFGRMICNVLIMFHHYHLANFKMNLSTEKCKLSKSTDWLITISEDQ